jgi:hypothetical protein
MLSGLPIKDIDVTLQFTELTNSQQLHSRPNPQCNTSAFLVKCSYDCHFGKTIF